jgi:hypothetical protein
MTRDTIICEKCGASLETFNDKCSAPLDEMCDGFVCIELDAYPDGRNLVACDPDQVERCRKIVQST